VREAQTSSNLLEEPLTLVLEIGVIGQRLFHIVVLLLQYTGENQTKKPKPTFISSTRWRSMYGLRLVVEL